jgi:hypothetical protein
MWSRATIRGTAMPGLPPHPRRMRRRLTAALALSLLALAAQTSALSETPRQTYSERFTTDEPGASTGRAYAIDWVNPNDRDGKPPAFSHLRVELGEGARFDTSAIPQCRASDAELMTAGASACPRDSVVANDETLLDSGFPEPGRYVNTDLVFFNNRNELVLLATIGETGTRVVLRAQVGRNTIDLDVPLLPGTPPDGGAAKRQRGTFYPRSTRRGGRRHNYLTTPLTCPSSGYWVNKVTYTYRDGVKQSAQSRSPCRPPAADHRRPVIRAQGIPRRCVRRAFRVRLRIADASALRSVRVRLGRRTLARSRRKRLAVRIPARRLRPGRHTIRVVAVDAHRNRAQRKFRFRRCRL